MIVWLMGESGSGKTTMARLLQKQWPCVILDGDEMRESISRQFGFSREDRAVHNCRVSALAKVLDRQMNVVVAVIAPVRWVRKDITEFCNPLWIWAKKTVPARDDHFFEEPGPEALVLDQDAASSEENLVVLLHHIKAKGTK